MGETAIERQTVTGNWLVVYMYQTGYHSAQMQKPLQALLKVAEARLRQYLVRDGSNVQH